MQCATSLHMLSHMIFAMNNVQKTPHIRCGSLTQTYPCPIYFSVWTIGGKGLAIAYASIDYRQKCINV